MRHTHHNKLIVGTDSTRAQIELLEGRRLLAVISVANTNDTGIGSFRAAIVAAVSGDTIDLSAVTGTIHLASTLTIDKSLTITGPTSDTLTLDGDNVVKIMDINNTAAATAVISDLNFAHGIAGDGAAIQTDSDTAVTLNRCHFSNNHSTGTTNVHGGAIYAQNILTLNACVFTGNTVSGTSYARGGAVYAKKLLTVNDTTFTSNTATSSDLYAYGGAVSVENTIVVTRSTFSGNVATITNNYAIGGAVDIQDLNSSGTSSFVNATFAENSVTAVGGGNRITYGGAIYSLKSFSLTNCTIDDNSATSNLSYGGGIYLAAGTLTMNNTIVAENTAVTGPDIYLGFLTATTTGGNNLVGRASSLGIIDGLLGNIIGTLSSLVDPKLNVLGDYGGSTPTLSIQVGSPVIDAASNLLAPATDQRGASRIGTSDIGAFEFGNHAPLFNSAGITTIKSGETYHYTIQGFDFDNDLMNFTATTLPSWLTLTENGNGTATLAGVAPYVDATDPVVLKIDDGSETVEQTFDIVVEAPKPIVSLSPQGVLSITGVTTNDNIHAWIRNKGQQIRVIFSNDTKIRNYPTSELTRLEIDAGTGDDLVQVSTGTIPAYVLGGDGNDTIIGDMEDDIFVGGNGDDRLYGKSGNDNLFGNDGNDGLFGGLGNDVLTGGAGNDTLRSEGGRDVLRGEIGRNSIFAKDLGFTRIFRISKHDIIRTADRTDVIRG